MITRFLETVLWNSRYAALVIVVLSLVMAVGVLAVTTYDAILLVDHMWEYIVLDLGESERQSRGVETTVRVVGIFDGYLIAAILIIFALGIYELFVDRIQAAENSDLASRLLLVRSLDDLKDRLANVVLLILIVKFFQLALNIKYKDALEVLYLAIGVVLVAAALYLSGRAKPDKSGKAPPRGG